MSDPVVGRWRQRGRVCLWNLLRESRYRYVVDRLTPSSAVKAGGELELRIGGPAGQFTRRH